MHHRTLRCLITAFLLCFMVNAAPARPAEALMMIKIKPMFAGKPFKLGDRCVTPMGDTITIDKVRFYLSNFQLIKNKGTIRQSAAYLIDFADSTTCILSLPVSDWLRPEDSLAFTIGIDSISNTNGANGGDLDPAKGMYWAWNTGYIMAKLEGHSPVCPTLHNELQYHIGGYLPPYNAAQKVALALKPAYHSTGVQRRYIVIHADLAAWFTPNVDIKTLNSVLNPGKEALQIAQNYAKMFTIAQ